MTKRTSREVRLLALLLFLGLSLWGCMGKRGRRSTPLLPNVSGKAGEVLVCVERELWEGDFGNLLREKLSGDTPYLAQREPLFLLSNVTPSGFSSMFQLHRNVLVVQRGAAHDSSAVFLGHDFWAHPQSVVRMEARDAEALCALLAQEGDRIAEFFEQSERDRIVANARLYEKTQLQEPVAHVTGGVLHFPQGYRLRKLTDRFAWIADEKQYTNQTVLVYTYPVPADGTPFSVEAMVQARNEVMQANVPGMAEGSYMTTYTDVPPTVRSLRYRGRAFMEMRGFWEVHGDFMGGPFTSHAFYSKDGKDIVVLEAFVYAPRYDKRQYLRQVESLLYSFEWQPEEVSSTEAKPQ